MIKRLMASETLRATVPLLIILSIILFSTVAFIVFQLFSGNVPCGPFDAFDGTSGVVPMLDDIADFPTEANKTIKYVIEYRKAIRDNNMNEKQIKKVVKDAFSQTSYLMAFKTQGDRRGELLAAGSADGVCQGENPYCTVWAGGPAKYLGQKEGENCWNLRSPDGRYVVREMVAIADRGGGWYGLFWTSPEGKVHTQYIYIAPLREHKLLLASTFYASRLM